jgi:hypothetical protein
MPVTVAIDSSQRVIVSTYVGEVAEDEFRNAIKELPMQPGFDPAFSHIIDFSQLTVANVSTEFVKHVARSPSLFTQEARQVIVAPQTHIFGLARMAQILRGQQSTNIEVVQSLKKAYEILGIE